jgi:uncharacterized protein (TIGR01777 family)
MKVIVTGGTGYVGRPLVAALRAGGDTVVVLTRDPSRAPDGVEAVAANLEEAGPWQAAVAGAGAVVHLAGEPIAGARWDARQKQILRDSRVESTARIVDAIEALPAGERPAVLVHASGTDYYPFAPRGRKSGFDAGDDDITEADPPGDSFLGRLCRDWEAEAARAERGGVRVVAMRCGLVLGPGGGALAKLTGPYRFFVGGRLGSGEQWVSWIHLDDAVAAYRAAITDDRYRGPYNLVAPQPLKAGQLAKAIGRAMHRPALLPVPAFAVKLAVGEAADYVLEGRKVVPEKLRALGFAFTRPTIDDALRDAI